MGSGESLCAPTVRLQSIDSRPLPQLAKPTMLQQHSYNDYRITLLPTAILSMLNVVKQASGRIDRFETLGQSCCSRRTPEERTISRQDGAMYLSRSVSYCSCRAAQPGKTNSFRFSLRLSKRLSALATDTRFSQQIPTYRT